jgi:AraC-like DNA-binding protein
MDTHSDYRNPKLARLAALLGEHAPVDGDFTLAIPGLHAIRASTPSVEVVHGVQGPALCLIAQGAKTVMLGSERYDYDASRMLIFSLDLPIAAQVTEATRTEPYLCFRLDIDAQRIADLTLKVYPDGAPRVPETRAVYLARANNAVIDAAVRLMELLAQPDDAHLLAPLVTEEIFVRLLRSPVGGRLAQVGQRESNVHRVAKAVSWVRDHFAHPIKVDELAALAHMSSSSLHQHFKSVTSMSPLQYQKVMRLQEARRLLATGMSASTAGGRVGYVSASQFSREYARLFGSAPTRDSVRPG